ncbi:sensor histidine kinase [Paenibacillus hexagrammi]|uniref:histidine kinase n=1 Tax=Paenibacillus hexagrammi TaxID=2908839 RepID=A0ABY3SD09_9BACL|nr:sensor histidine kinase [Paenibacillus sp. YPD9-1]UJF31826.1 histidine kinase [Paenibacillus sp. YPD9-1]
MAVLKQLRFKNSVASKTIAALLVVILIPTIFISVLFYVSASTIVKHNVRQTSLQLVGQAADSLSNILNVGSDSSNLIFSDTSIQKLITLEDSIELSNQMDAAYITNTLNNIAFSNSFVKMVYVLRENGGSWGSGTFSQNKLNRFTLHNFSWIKKADEMDGKMAWSPMQFDLFSGAGENIDLVIPGVRVMKDFRDLHNIGYIMINIDGKEALKIISRLTLGRTGTFFVVDREGNMMINKDITLVGSEVADELKSHLLDESVSEFEYEEQSVTYYGVKHTLSNGWIIVGIVPTQELTGQLDHLRGSIFNWSIGLFLLAIGIGLWSARKITSPIKQLTKQMKLVGEGNLDVRTTIESSDEIGMLSLQFNKMIYQVNELMYQVEEEQSKKRKAELRAVTHQINPHFMFNTLNTIRWLIKFGDKDKAFEGITNFNRLMEANMGKKE